MNMYEGVNVPCLSVELSYFYFSFHAIYLKTKGIYSVLAMFKYEFL